MNEDQNKNCSCSVCNSDGIKKAGIWVLAILAVFLVAKSINEFKKYPTVGKDVPVVNTISVSGKGEVVEVPDIATFSFGVTEESLSVATAQSDSAKSVNAVMDYLGKNGVDKKDIKTSNYNIYPRYEYQSSVSSYYVPEGKRTLAGYVVSQTVEVKIRKIADAGKIIGGIGELGATDISGLSFGFDKEDELKAKARKEAVAKAKAEAVTIARDLGVSLGRVVSYNESGNYPMYYGMGGDMMSAKVSAAPEITPGESKIISTVSITYEIR